ncbi:putative Ca2+/H+ antiporter (TMEM165/GDT1 family) [Altererythrobacter atlanticus]|uniref:Uncharacterized protein n=1 Tax=Croceibacterium atlanticum TaxID=1267766 RepID=A0A0F7KYY1_9SPHN|nr:hypothetical protein [Croceibacterium atlanticum]AKH44030.1 hypothetical protein WYH_03010 [Croceibacterium atlanticum]MBB5732337.1 putative Ca2+/H+ antiporter (TMEM165/GDT1 family) [Croceibacterium atlanticum]
MPAFFTTLIACVLATIGGREVVSTARLSHSLGQGVGLLVAIWASCIASSALAAWVGGVLAPMMAPDAKQVFAAMALLMGAGELALLRPRRKPAEPTRSAGAMLLVLLASQITDAARFLVLALSVANGVPMLAAAGGALGSGIVLTFAWAMGAEWEERLPLAALRWAAATLLLLAGAAMLLIGLGILA